MLSASWKRATKLLSLRWQDVVPRLLLVVVAAMGVQYVLDLAARALIVRSCETALATKVEIAQARCSPLDRQIVLGPLRVENPCRPGTRLLEADCCELEIELGPLLQKQTIIDCARLSGLRVGTTTADDAGKGAQPQSPATHNWFTADSGEQAREWLTLLTQRFKQPWTHQFESVDRTDALCARWPVERAALNQRAAELKNRAAELQAASDAAEANRLRHADFFRALPSRTAELEQDFDQFGAEIEQLSASLESDRRAIVAARQRDEELLRQRIQLEPLDANSLTAYLLCEQLASPLDQLIGWLRWMRQVVPAEPLAPRQTPGEEIVLAAGRPPTSFLLRTLQIQGTARFGTQSAELRGLLTDVTNAPSRHAAPMRLRLKSSGSLPLELQATIDRTGAMARDELLVDCRGVDLPAAMLGRSDELELKLAPSVGALSISVAVEGAKLSGDIQLVQQQARITPGLQGELAGVPLAAPLQATLGRMDCVATRLSLQGTLDEPSCVVWSNLGPAVAEALERASRQAGNEHAQALLADARRRVDERLADLERRFAEERTKLATELNGLVNQVETIARRQSARDRLSVEHIGRRPPENSLFR